MVSRRFEPFDRLYGLVLQRQGYLQAQEFGMQAYGLYTTCLLPGMRAFYEQICRYNAHQKYPVVSLLFCTVRRFGC